MARAREQRRGAVYWEELVGPIQTYGDATLKMIYYGEWKYMGLEREWIALQ